MKNTRYIWKVWRKAHMLIDLLFVCVFLSIIYVLKFLLYAFNIFYFETINKKWIILLYNLMKWIFECFVSRQYTLLYSLPYYKTFRLFSFQLTLDHEWTIICTIFQSNDNYNKRLDFHTITNWLIIIAVDLQYRTINW